MLALRRSSIAAAALALGACADPTGTSKTIGDLPRPLTRGERTIIGASNEFAFSLFQRMNAEQSDANLFLSPLSVSMALGMTMNGAAGETLSEMRTLLGFGDLEMGEVNESYRSLIALLRGLDARVDFRIANSIWHDEGFPIEQPFVHSVTTFFDARIAGRAFDDPGTLTAINDWVTGATAGKIDKILDAIAEDAVMYLINAIYFNGDWTTQFDPQLTESQPFAGRGGATQVPLMHVTDSVRYAEVDGTKIVELPYGGGAFAMSVILPSPDAEIDEFVAGLSAADWDALHAAASGTPVLIWLPKFTLAREYTLNEALQSLGMRRAFGGGDFTPMSRALGHLLEVSEVKHKTFVDVHEKGTEAAAITSVGVVVVCACGPNHPVFRADRPFIFAIRERLSGTILFMGKIVRF